MRRFAAAVLILFVLTLAGCGRDNPPAAPATASAAPSVATSAAAALGDAADADGAKACALVAQAQQGGLEELMKAGTVEEISRAAAGSTDFGIKFGGQMLADRYDVAVAQVGTDDEVSSGIRLFGAATDLSTACIEAGLSGD